MERTLQRSNWKPSKNPWITLPKFSFLFKNQHKLSFLPWPLFVENAVKPIPTHFPIRYTLGRFPVSTNVFSLLPVFFILTPATLISRFLGTISIVHNPRAARAQIKNISRCQKIWTDHPQIEAPDKIYSFNIRGTNINFLPKFMIFCSYFCMVNINQISYQFNIIYLYSKNISVVTRIYKLLVWIQIIPSPW